MRNLDAHEFFENFLISAVAAILSIRVFLYLSGYPTVGGESLHIAHMLWGGLLMLVALLMLLGFLGKPVKSAAAVIGGAGWGTFIDELGKFLTHDNDYFFEPTFALIYVSFVLLYVAWERLHGTVLSREDALANALELMLEAVRKDMDVEERRRALDLLAGCDSDDPVVRSITRGIEQVDLAPPGRPGLMWRLRHGARGFYRWLSNRRWFSTAVVAFFVIHSANIMIQAMTLVDRVALSLGVFVVGLLLAGVLLERQNDDGTRRYGVPAAAAVIGGALLMGAALAAGVLPDLSFFEWAELLSAVVPALFVLLGVARIRRSRLDAFRTFKTAVLIMIFITQFFAFYHQQLLALLGLFVNIVVWVTLRSMIQQEERMPRRRPVV
ncbi:hypothetical protein BH23GEM9_BH23GEM9_16340 [soil metagenome]